MTQGFEFYAAVLYHEHILFSLRLAYGWMLSREVEMVFDINRSAREVVSKFWTVLSSGYSTI